MTGKGDRFLGDTFLEAAVTSEGNDVVVEESMLGSVELGRSALARHGVTDGITDALTERASGGFDTWSLVILGMAGSDAVKLAEVFERLKWDVIAGEVQPAVDEHRTVTCGQDEAVAVEPLGSGRVEVERLGEKDGTDFGTTEGESEVAGRAGVDGINGEAASFGGGFLQNFCVHGKARTLDNWG